MAVHRLLYVCSQNVCRSPYGAMRFRLAMDALAPGAVKAVSRGTDVNAPRPMCRLAAERLASAHGWNGTATDHVSRQLTPADVARARLILTASTAERSVVALLEPAARARTFTIREAVLLSEAPLDDAEQQLMRDASLDSYAQVLHARRGTLHLHSGPQPRRWFGQTRAGNDQRALDIPDRHTQRDSAHSEVFLELDRDVALLASHIASALGDT